VADPPLAPVIVVGCTKGGIGRTALAVNLAAMFALAGKRTLLVDLDGKGDATASVGLPRARKGKSLARYSEPWSFLKDTFNAPSPPGLDVWPGGPAIERAQAEPAESGDADHLDRGPEQARRRYRAIVIDAPSDLGPVSRTALASGDCLLIPMSTAAHHEEAVNETIRAALAEKERFAVFGVRIESRAPIHEGDEDQSDEREPVAGFDLLDSTICFDPDTFQEAAQRGLPVFEAAPGSLAARCFLELGREVMDIVL